MDENSILMVYSWQKVVTCICNLCTAGIFMAIDSWHLIVIFMLIGDIFMTISR